MPGKKHDPRTGAPLTARYPPSAVRDFVSLLESSAGNTRSSDKLPEDAPNVPPKIVDKVAELQGSIVALPPELKDIVVGNLDWTSKYHLLQTCEGFARHIGPEVSRSRQDEPGKTTLADEHWMFGDKFVQSITVLRDHRGYVDGHNIRMLRRANGFLFKWDVRCPDNVWANHRDVRDAKLVLQVPLHRFRLLLDETSDETRPRRLLARHMQLSHPPIGDVFASVILFEQSTGQEKGIKEWRISRKGGVRLGDVMKEVQRNIKSTAEDLPLLKIKFWKSVCPTGQEISRVHAFDDRYIPAEGARVNLEPQFSLPSRFSPEEVIEKLNSR